MKPYLGIVASLIFAAGGILFAIYYQEIWNYAWDSWHGKTITWKGLTVNLQEGQFLHRPSERAELMIGDRMEPINMLTAMSAPPANLAPSIVATDFCDRVKCSNKADTELKINGKIVRSAEVRYSEGGALLIRYYAKVESSSLWIEIVATERSYPRFASLARSLLSESASQQK